MFFCRWAIKTNDNIIKLLRNHRHYFTNDDAINFYIRDSDLWQSYKRRTITEFLTLVGKDRVALGQQDIPGPLFRAVEFGEANRLKTGRIKKKKISRTKLYILTFTCKAVDL